MNRVLKIAAWIIGVIVALVIAAAIVIPLVVNPNDYRDQITAVVKKQTGRELTIEGNLSISVFPWLGLDVGALRLSNAPGFGKQPFLQLKEAEVRIKLLPLLRRNVEIDTVRLKGVVVHLARKANGATNWEDLTGKPAAPGKKPEPEKAPAEREGGKALGALAVGGVEVRDAQVDWDDQQAKQHVTVSDLDLNVGAVRSGKPFPVNLDMKVSSDSPKAEGRITMGTTVTVDLGAKRYRLAQTELTTNLKTPLAPGGQLQAHLTAAEAQAALDSQTADLKKLRLEAYGSYLTGELTATGITGQPSIEGHIEMAIKEGDSLAQALAKQLPKGVEVKALQGSELKADFNAAMQDQTASIDQLVVSLPGATLKLHAQATRIKDGPRVSGSLDAIMSSGKAALSPVTGLLPGQMELGQFDGTALSAKYAADLEQERLEISNFRAATLGLQLTGHATGKKILSEPELVGELKSNEFVPRDITKALKIELPPMKDPNTLTKASLDMGFGAGSDRISVNDLRVRLDASTLTGKASVARFRAPVIRYDLALDEMNVDRYLPPPEEETKGAKPVATPGGAAAGGAAQLPMELMRKIDIDGKFSIGRLQAANLRSQQISTLLRAKNGVFRLNPASARLYGGTYQGNLTLDASGNTPRFVMDEKLTGVQSGPLLNDLMGKPYVTGTANLTAALRAQGLDATAVRKSLSGKAGFHFTNGAIKGVSIGELIRREYARLKRQPLPKGQAQQTDFAELKGTLQINNGVARNDDLTAKSPLLRVNGKGEINLAKETVDYLVTATLVSSMKGQGGKEASELKGVPIPVRFTGPLSDPKPKVDLAPVLEQRAREALDKEKGKAQQRLEEEKKKLQRKLEDRFKSLLK